MYLIICWSYLPLIFNSVNWIVVIYYVPRCVGILRIAGKNFRMDKFRLKTVRPFYTKDVILADTDVDPTDDAAIQEYLAEQVRAD